MKSSLWLYYAVYDMIYPQAPNHMFQASLYTLYKHTCTRGRRPQSGMTAIPQPFYGCKLLSLAVAVLQL